MRRTRRSLGWLPVVLFVTAALSVPGGGSGGGGHTVSLGSPSIGAFVASPARVTIAPAFVPSAGWTDLGPVGESTSFTVAVGLASRDPSGLSAFVNATAIPGTPFYRHFLSAEAADSAYGALPGAVSAAEGYFEGFGLATAVHPDGLILSVSGPGPAVARAFGTTLDTYRGPSGVTLVSHPTPASLPELAPWTGAIGLDSAASFLPVMHSTAVGPGTVPASACAGFTGVLDPCQVAQAYDFAGLQAAGTTGKNERIAVIDAYSAAENQSQLASDFSTFSASEGLPSTGLSFAYPVRTDVDLNVTGTNYAWQYEDALDVEWSHAAAPGAAVEMVFSPDSGAGLYFAVDWVVGLHEADVLSMSWGEPEVGVFNAEAGPCLSACNASSDGSFAILDPLLELGASEGITTFASSGDCGSADGTSGVAVNYPASDPFVTGIGATDLSLSSNGSYGGETAWDGNGSGATAPGCQNLGGSGGGYSILPRPWWQTGPGTAPSRGRGVPDVAIAGGNGSQVVIVSENLDWAVYGTSVSSPIWAGIAAMADQAYGSDLGWLDPSLYRILGGSNYSRDFHEVLEGWNGYSAHAGWNPLTGIGTPIVANLTRDLARVLAGGSNLTTFVYASPRFGAAPLTVQFAITAQGGAGAYPFEGIDFGDSNASVVTPGIVTHAFAAPGVYAVQSYVADSSGNTSESPPVVVVVGSGGPLSVDLTTSSADPSVGSAVTFDATAKGAAGPYLYNYSFGDGTFADNLSSGSVTHAYEAQGSYCAEVVVRTLSPPWDGGASLRLSEAVGGAASASCGNPSQPLSITTSPNGTERDAPADFVSLFTPVGGSTAPAGLGRQWHLVSNDPYTAACACTIVRGPGNYTFREWWNDSVGGEAYAIVNVTVAAPLKATFTASTLAGPVPLTVRFSATASGGLRPNAAATQWSFGDGEGATGASVPATYTKPGEYVAIASLSDRGHGNASEAFVIDAEAPGTFSVGITATVTPAVNVSSGSTVSWFATTVGPAAATAGSSVTWNLGNGGGAFGRYANETYFASTDRPAGDVLAASVEVDSPFSVPLVHVPIDLPGFFALEAGGVTPAADALRFSASLGPVVGEAPFLATGNATATGPGGATLGWTFGDGGQASGTSVSHAYYYAGRFTVEVRAQDGSGDAGDRLIAVDANAALALVGCGSSDLSVTTPATVHLAPVATGGAGPPYGYQWTLPNGTYSDATNVTLTFPAAGTYHVVVVVRDASSATARCAWSIVVAPAPPVTFLEIALIGVAAGVLLAAVFVVITRPPRPR